MSIPRARALALVGLCAASGAVLGDEPGTAPTRPTPMMNRWQEDWSVLADPALRTQPLDQLKYMPLSEDSPDRYLSLGLTLRERFESNDAPGFGVGGVAGDSYVLQRLQLHADLHFVENWRLFVQLEDVRAFDKTTLTPVDANKADLRLAFIETVDRFAGGTLKARVGRQDFAFDLQRFVSSRDGPNVRQSFDAVWADWETDNWRFIGFLSRPVQYEDVHSFDDRSNNDFRFHTLRVERHVLGTNELSAYWSLYERSNAHYIDGSGKERRQILDARFAGSLDALDWDVESMLQGGTVGSKRIRAGAFGPRVGYNFRDSPWRPCIGLQLDAASGDTRPGDSTVGTFNPLFPNGYYFSLAGYTGYTNLVQLKPSLTVHPDARLALLAGLGLQWRATEADAVYIQPNVPVAGTAGRPGKWTGAYGQLRADYKVNRNLTTAIEAVHYQVGDVIRRAGGHDGNYISVEAKFMW